MLTVDVCYSPELLHLYNLQGRVVVVVDILRATSSMVTAFAHGVEKMVPVSKLQECMAYRKKGFLTAAERDGQKAEGFDLGNSPFSYMDESIQGKAIAITTTNGTQAIRLSISADTVVIGSFLNISAVARFVQMQQKSVIIVCAAWKGKFNLEDTLFAGALIEKLGSEYEPENDATLGANVIWEAAKADRRAFLENSSHVKRLARLDIVKDVDFCLQDDVYDVVPVWQGAYLTKAMPVLVD
ncbi:2-phosphosulfolactate phosphatase [Adhaeribacter soli]|uniref:Probable 2-phosphosulfolactate phosphatase n=1 Tax=Adhaeribacter soli TaxID=2607655 RepID=A0A5N1J2N1_9BACT|nr:2-phosphosulfolactate phosphatase [Adhaeribacter soli]KAA9340766.1 2-phosphosulfolactate phosphatase [Adhaeribacter soli]